MTEYEQRLYDVIADWWDEVFARPRKLDKNDTIIDLVKSISKMDDAPWLDTTYDGFMTHEEMLEVAEQREKENKVLQIAKDLIDQNGDAMKALAAIEKDELIDQAIEELGWIVAGGQDGEEFTNSILFIKKVLQYCKQCPDS